MDAASQFVYTEPPRNASAHLLREARHRHGMSRDEAAQAIGCSVVTIGRWEREGLPECVRYRRFLRVCEVYGLSADELCSLIARTDVVHE